VQQVQRARRTAVRNRNRSRNRNRNRNRKMGGSGLGIMTTPVMGTVAQVMIGAGDNQQRSDDDKSSSCSCAWRRAIRRSLRYLMVIEGRDLFGTWRLVRRSRRKNRSGKNAHCSRRRSEGRNEVCTFLCCISSLRVQY